jgi:hypothetical protein
MFIDRNSTAPGRESLGRRRYAVELSFWREYRRWDGEYGIEARTGLSRHRTATSVDARWTPTAPNILGVRCRRPSMERVGTMREVEYENRDRARRGVTHLDRLDRSSTLARHRDTGK